VVIAVKERPQPGFGLMLKALHPSKVVPVTNAQEQELG
jgi:hypothetical protein